MSSVADIFDDVEEAAEAMQSIKCQLILSGHMAAKLLGVFFLIPFLFLHSNRSMLAHRILEAASIDQITIDLLKHLFHSDIRPNETQGAYIIRQDRLIDTINEKLAIRDEICKGIPYNSYVFTHFEMWDDYYYPEDEDE